MAPNSAELCVGAVVVEDDRLLLIKRGRGAGIGQWSVPGGRVEPGETLAQALEREVAEETSLAVTCGPFIGWVERISPDYHFVIMDFWAQLTVLETHDETGAGFDLSVDLTGPGVAGDDAAALAWVHKTDLHRYDLVDGLVSFLSEHGVLP